MNDHDNYLFVEKYRQLLKERGSTIYQIAKSANLERTCLNKMLNGKRELLELFIKCKHGGEIVERRDYMDYFNDN